MGNGRARRRPAALSLGPRRAGTAPRGLRPRLQRNRVDREPARRREPYKVEDMLGNLREWTLTPYPYRTDGDREPYTGASGRVVVRGASHDDPADSLGLTRRRSYDRRGAAAGHHFAGFRCATSEDLGEVAPGGRSR